MYLVVGRVVLTDNPFHEAVEAVIGAQKILHRGAGQESKNRDEVCWVAAPRHLGELIADVYQTDQLVIVVVIAPSKAHSTDHISNRDNNVAEGVEAAVGFHDSV